MHPSTTIFCLLRLLLRGVRTNGLQPAAQRSFICAMQDLIGKAATLLEAWPESRNSAGDVRREIRRVVHGFARCHSQAVWG
jgi:hypothetical protein